MACENWNKCREWAIDELKTPTPEMCKAGAEMLGLVWELPEGAEVAARLVYEAMMTRAA